MSSLAIRASSVKNSDDSKKSSEIKYTVLNLPATNVFAAEPSDSEANHALQGFKNEYSRAKGVDQQLSAVNKLLVHYTNTNPWILDEKILSQILADLYFYAPPKHPLRSILAKALHKEAAKKGDLIIESMTRTIIDSNGVIQESLQQNKFDTVGVRSFVSSLYGCFDNFPEAAAAIKSCLSILLQSLQQFIDIFMQKLQSDLSPARRSEVFIDLHNTSRVVVSAIQQFYDSITDSSLLETILSQCWAEFLDNPVYADSPVDTKINCAILKVNYDRSFGDIFAPREKILTQFVTSEKMSSLKPTTTLSKEIYYAIAVINTTVEKDLSDSNYFPALNAIVDRLISVGCGSGFTKDPCLIMAVTRALVACTKKLLSLLRKVSLHRDDDAVSYLRKTVEECLSFVWINVHHSVDCVRYLSKDLLKNVLKLGQEQPEIFGDVVNETVSMAKSNSTSETLVCLLLDYLCQVFTTEFVLSEMPNIQQRILQNLFNDSCWATCYEQLLLKNSEINLEKWCLRWIQPLMRVDPRQWKNDFDRLKIIRNLFERALKTRPEAAEYILTDANISIEIHLFVLWIMRRSGRKIYAPENYRVSADQKVIFAKVHPSDEIRILAFRILIECHKVSALFPVEDLNEILEFFRFNCNVQNPAMRQQMNTTMKRAMNRLECGYCTAIRAPTEENAKLCTTYETFLRDLIAFCVDWCLFDGANFGRRTIGLTTLLYSVETWQKILPENSAIYTEKLWIRLQRTLSDTYVNNKDVASDILLLCWKFYPEKKNFIYSMVDLKKFVTTFRPYDVMTSSHYLVFSAFSETYFKNYYDAVLWCETILDDGLAAAKKSLLHMARYNALYGLVLTIRQLLKRIDFSSISDAVEIANWRSFFQRIIIKCKELTDVAAPVVNSSAPEGHLPNDLNDVSHYLDIPNEENDGGSKVKVTAQMILLCAWRTVRESALLLGEISLRIPVLTASNPNGLVSVDQLLQISGHFQQLLVETKHRGAFEQSFLGFSNLCLRLWRSHEPQLHSYPTKLVDKIAKIISGECCGNESDAEIDVKKLCATRRSAGVPFMVQGVVTTESQVCSSSALHFCITTFLNIAKTGVVQESRTHSLNILRALFKCSELGEAVSEYASDGIECSIRGYSAPSWPERNSSTLLFSALMIRVFGVPRTKVSENVSIKNKMTGRLFFIRYPRLYDFFYVELKSASEAIERNERPPRLHPLLLLISRLYPSAREGTESNLRLSTYIPFISTCSSSPELVTRQLSAKSIVALIPLANIAERLSIILGEISTHTSLNTIHGCLLQVLYLIRSTKQENYEIDTKTLKEFTIKLVHLKLPVNNIIAKTYLEILLEILLTDRFYPIDPELANRLIEVRDKFVKNFAQSNQYDKLTQSYVQKSFTIFNLLLSANVKDEMPIISTSVLNTQNELIETQLNIKYLFLCRPNQEIIESTNDFSRYEIELFKFFTRNHTNNGIILRLLLSTKDLYHVIEHKREFYPFGVIKAYEILSLLIAPAEAFTNNLDLRRLQMGQLMEHMNAIDKEGVDDVEESMWKFITAHLRHCQIHPSHVITGQIQEIVAHLRNSTQSYKSLSLRQTITDVLAIIIQYFAQCTNLEVIIDVAELLLSLLRDDDLYVRNRTSEIVMDLIHHESKESFDKVIPLAAEDHLLQWLDSKFVQIARNDVWSKWLDLLRLVFAPLGKKQEDSANDDNNEDNLIDVEIFDDSEPNTFDEAIYSSHKCYTYMVKHINSVQMNPDQKLAILSEFSPLQNL
ncbi:thyroid adenoma-associated protein homolog [Sitodiplosis mosellana]|uniref:thyroid adenoma-associated protein homolog n=1 Tax=Sitodiplosis mosellana TaxID=263140 RepID=UPI002444FB70|nr:thyroid adenoma-associated protein homolog [Sitodiplosis mosellana]